MILFALVVWLLIIVSIGYVIDRLWVSLSPGKWYRYIQAPGIMIHELSHVLGCFVAGADVNGIKLYDPEGGSVTHGKPMIPLLGEVIISLAPLVGCPVALYVITRMTGTPFDVPTKLQDNFDLSLSSFGNIFVVCAQLVLDAASGLLRSLRSDLFSLRTWMFVYFASVLTMRMAPTKADFRSSVRAILVLAIAFAALAIVGRHPLFHPLYELVRGWVWAGWRILSLGAGLLFLILFASTLAAGIARAVKASATPEKASRA